MLPVDSVLEDLFAALDRSPFVVLEAPPGAGKTTRVPFALLERMGSGSGEVVVTEPRRLAARLAASHVAKERGVELGGLVGYSVRFDDRTSRATRLRYVTEGVLLNRMLGDPELRGVRHVVLDEFHERHVESDRLLALLRRLIRRGGEPSVLIMSATLDAEAIADHLGGCPRVRSEGRRYPLSVEYDTELEGAPLEKRVSLATKRALASERTGHILVFLPGAREIAQCRAQLETALRGRDIDILPLHGDQPLEAQARAVAPSSRRKVVLATNVAESSVTIDGVDTVIDSGLARLASFSARAGRSTLVLAEVSQHSCIQRAGRAGRMGPGRAIRLYGESNFKRRATATPPEILRADLSELMLDLHGRGLHIDELEWLDPAPSASVRAAETLLGRLGAVKGGKLTALGRRMLELPLSPRLARVLLEGERLGIGGTAALAVALLTEGDLLERRSEHPGSAESGDSDLQLRVDRYRMAERDGFGTFVQRSLELRPRTVSRVRRVASQLGRLVSADEHDPDSELAEQKLRRALLAGFPDGVARRQTPGSDQLVLFDGTRARLSPRSIVHQGQLLLALDVEESSSTMTGGSRDGAFVRAVSTVDANWLLDDHPDAVEASETLHWNPERQRVETVCRLSYGALTLEESRSRAPQSEAASRLLYESLVASAFAHDALSVFEPRARLLEEHGLGLTSVPDAAKLLQAAAADRTSLEEVERLDLSALLQDALSPEDRERLRRDAPEQVTLPGGRRVPIHYEAGRPPWIASRLQDFFGMRQGPSICRGRLPLVLHLLAPNQRAVQVTSDLEGFWQRHYPELRKQLSRRYPRHAWPEDGAAASPPAAKPRRS